MSHNTTCRKEINDLKAKLSESQKEISELRAKLVDTEELKHELNLLRHKLDKNELLKSHRTLNMHIDKLTNQLNSAKYERDQFSKDCELIKKENERLREQLNMYTVILRKEAKLKTQTPETQV